MRKIIVILLCITSISCQKESIDIESEFNNSYLKFESFDEVIKLLDPQSTLDIKQYAESQNVVSFYYKSHEIYKRLRDAKYENPDDIFKAFEKYNKYVEIVSVNGEYEAQEKLYNSFFKYIINEDQIFQMGDALYKIFENDIVKTDQSNYTTLANVSQLDIKNLEGNKILNVISLKRESYTKNTGHDISLGDINRSDIVGNKRVKMEISLNYASPLTVWRYFRIAPQKRIWPIWFNYNANTTAEIKWRWDAYYVDGNEWETESEKIVIDGVTDDVFDHVFNIPGFTDSNYIDYHFRGFDCTATTVDIPGESADLEFNISLIGTIDNTRNWPIN